MAGIRVHVVMPAELVARVDAVRGEGMSRGEFVRRAVEQALGGVESAAGVEPRAPLGDVPGVRELPAPAEQPVDPDWLEPPSASYRSSSFAKRDVRPVPKRGA